MPSPRPRWRWWEGDASVAEALLALRLQPRLLHRGTKVGKLVMAAAAKTLASVTLELGKSPAMSPRPTGAAARHRLGSSSTPARPASPPTTCWSGGAARGAVGALRASTVASYGPEEGWARNGDLAGCGPRCLRAGEGSCSTGAAAGARVAFGGTTDAGQRFIAPRCWSTCRRMPPSSREEIFGPVLPVVSYRTEAGALAYVRSRPSRWRSIRSGRAPRPAPPSPGPPRAG
jgi:aldehyde dehydrogenase (NAD+)